MYIRRTKTRRTSNSKNDYTTVLAYQLVQFIRRKLEEQEDHNSWKNLRIILSTQCRVTATFTRKDGRTLHVCKTSQAEPEQRKIYQNLGINPDPVGIKKMIV
ncbi:MAG: hypothetical protein U9R69_00205 [Thermodesulfobacteriota bacterium]|nr:hypothetical protein [Thermodesulfobacteriota bacterium]